MRWISRAFTLARSLGVLGLILLLGVALLGWTVYNMAALQGTVTEVYDTVEGRSKVADMRLFLFDQELNQDYYLLAEGDPDYADGFFGNADTISGLIDEFQPWADAISEKSRTALDNLAAGQEEYAATFAEMMAAADSGEDTEVDRLKEVAEQQAGQMHQRVDDLLFEIETVLRDDVQQIAWQAQWAVLSGVIGLVVFPLLGVWAFVVASRVTEPVLVLTNAAVAIEGNQFRPDLLGDVGERRDGLGQLARSLERLAGEAQEREQALGREVAQLREQLYTVRRRKMYPTSPQRDME